MSRTLIFLLLVIGAALLIGCETNHTKTKGDSTADNIAKEQPVFQKIAAETSGIVFSNTITHKLETLENLFNFDYFYNGAGVGIEDLNNDGLLDIFFCGNQVPNKLFINQGNLTFKDVSETAGINQGKQWANGVTFADLNGDGWMDIYLSQGGPNKRLQRKNLLFLNQKDGTFREVGEEFGLADMGISTQSAFLDYDRDGDLDCIVMNENELYGVDPINLFKLIGDDEEMARFNSSHLYRNDGGKFTDVTKEAGLQRPIFGLGLMVSDFNTDGWMDIYLASDYYIPDALFINQKDGTFKDRIDAYTQQISYYGMGIDVADINNDLLQDIFVLDMASSDHYRSKTLMASMNTGRFNYLVNKAGFHHQYMYNSLQLNLGENHYSNIAQLGGMANTDWSWSVLMSDFDLDSDKDIYVTNGYRRYALDNDLQLRVFDARKQYGRQMPLEVKRSLYESMPSEKLPNLLFQNNGGLNFTENGYNWGLGDLTFSNGAAMGDLDNDGDLDLVVNNMDENAFLYRNTASDRGLGNYLNIRLEGENSESFATISVHYEGGKQLVETKRVRGYMSSHENAAHFGLGQVRSVDRLMVRWPDGAQIELRDIPVNQTLTLSKKEASKYKTGTASLAQQFRAVAAEEIGLDFYHKENSFDDFEREILLPYRQSTLGPYMAKADVNGDGNDDIYIGGASGQAGKLYIQTSGGFRASVQESFENDRTYEDMEAVFFDLDGDQDQDLYVVSGGNAFPNGSSLYADRVYLNDGKGQFSRSPNFQQSGFFSGKAVTKIDFDGDGDQDIVVGNRIIPQSYPNHSPSVLYENVNGILKDVTAEKAAGLLDFGIINQVLATDFDHDGREDLIVVGEWTGIGFFKNTAAGLTPLESPLDSADIKGWWYSVAEIDANGDGLNDYLVGNVGHNLKFTASEEKPFRIYATDFDDNGTHDIVLSKKYNGEYVPVRGRECSSQQMPFIKEKFPSYSEFAKATLKDVYGESLDESYSKDATSFTSILLLNKGDGNFQSIALPAEAQFFPLMATVQIDLNKDGNKDLILAGNIYETEVETPRLDAVSGLVLLSDGKGNFRPANRLQTGLYLKGNIKDLMLLRNGEAQLLLASQNNGKLLVYQIL